MAVGWRAWEQGPSVISGDPVAEIKRFKEAEGKDIVQYGFGQLSHALLAHRLLDELHLWVHPLFVGNAEPSELIHRDGPGAMFDLVDTTSLQNGIVILSYRTREDSWGWGTIRLDRARTTRRSCSSDGCETDRRLRRRG